MNRFHSSSLKLLLHLQQRKNAEGGYSLVVTLAAIVLLGTLLVTAALVSKVDSSSTNASTDTNSGFYAAEAGLNLRANTIRNEFIGFNRPGGDEPATWEDCVDGNDGNNGSEDFACDTSISINDQQIVTFVDDVTEDDAISVTIEGGAFDGLSAQEYRYDLMSVALDTEGSEQSPTSILGMRFKSRLVPVFQFAAFYNQDLGLFRPPNMTLNGRVHSNGDLYLNSGWSTLTITGKVTTPGKLFRGEKPEDECYGTVNISTGSGYEALACGSGETRKSYDQSDLTAWNENILVGSDNYTLTLPDISNYQMPPNNILSDPDARKDYVYWEKADMRLVLQLDSSNNPTAIKIVNVDGSEDTTATNDLNACTSASTTLINSYGSTSVGLNVLSVSGFSVGDRIQVGNDIDSNVISATSDSVIDTITLRRQLGHSYQGGSIISAGSVVKKAVVSTSDTFYNYREKNGGTSVSSGSFIRMLDVDVQELIDCIDTSVSGGGLMGSKDLDDDTDGGLVWFFGVDGPDSHNDVTVDSPDSPNNYGVRLYNASELDSSNSSAKNIQGLTVVSDQAIYTQGHYNSVNKIPAALIGDSINVLSTAWKSDDSGSRFYNGSNLQDTTSATMTQVSGEEYTCYDYYGNAYTCSYYGDDERQADDTTINAAFFAGQDPMGGADGETYQDLGWNTNAGGLNNYPRFHEDWSNSKNCAASGDTYGRCTLTYLGSMVSFGKANRVNGPFCGSYYSSFGNCNIYTPPTRNWSFDTDFEQAQNLPPLTPRAVYVTQEIFERDFTYTSSKPKPRTLTALSNLFSPPRAKPEPFLTAFQF